MTINFVGNFQTGYVGEQADQVHLAREMEALGHKVQRVPQDIWREYVLGTRDENWAGKLPVKADINIITKWPHFENGSFCSELGRLSKAPVFYWLWDYMWDADFPDWHVKMAQAADLYLTNEYGIKNWYENYGVDNVYYFPFDVADGDLQVWKAKEKLLDVVFFGSWIGQGNRQEWLKEINKTNPIIVFSWNPQDWPEEFKDVREAVYGERFNQEVGMSKIILGFNVEPNCWGYWSNRMGKVLLAGGFLLYQYAPGMELFTRDGIEYFSSIEEAREKIDHYLVANDEREAIAKRGFEIGRDRFTSKARVKELMILCERYLKTHGTNWNY